MKAMTRSRLAAKAGVSLQTFCNWLRDHPELQLKPRGLISPDKVKRICEIFDIDL